MFPWSTSTMGRRPTLGTKVMKKWVIVVAHPDDEILWASALTSRYREDVDWTVICCCIPGQDPERGTVKFFDSCVILGVKPILMAEVEGGIKKPLLELDKLDLQQYDHIFTHNAEGEYGHLHHKQLHTHINTKWKHKQQTYFGFNTHKPKIKLTLTPEEVDRKMKAIRCYNNIYRDRPYYEHLLTFLGKLKQFDLSIETYTGDDII